MKYLKPLALLSSIIFLAACGGGGVGTDNPTPIPIVNTAPVASAGADQSVIANAVVMLDGSASFDANSDPLTYAWTLTSKPAGSAASLASPTSAKPTFTADVAGTYVASLIVNDSKVSSSAVTVRIIAAFESVTIGTQVWMLKNLAVATYRNGDPIPCSEDPSAWANLTTGAGCYYNNDASNATYGKLYNWYAVNDPRGLAPTGWHVATDAEWTTLTDYLGGDGVAQGKMKEQGTVELGTGHWHSPNYLADNSSGFTVLPGGSRGDAGAFDFIGYSALFWTATENGPAKAYAWQRFFSYQNESTGSQHPLRMSHPVSHGNAVRCVKN